MSTGIATRPTEPLPEAVESLLATGDLKQLTTAQRIVYYKARCAAANLDPRCRPFEFLMMKATENSPEKLVLYAKKECAEQLNGMHGISHAHISTTVDKDGLIEVMVQASVGSRVTVDIGAVNAKGLFGDRLANAKMKAFTKAKRRATLSLCGLGDVIDESELDTIATVRHCNENGTPNAIENHSGHGKGTYASEEQAATYLESMGKFLDEANDRWLNHWSSNCHGEIPKEVKEINRWQADGHLVKWALETGRIEPGSAPEDGRIQNRQIGRLTAIVYHRDKASRGALARELRRYVEEQQGRQMEAVKAKRPELFEGDEDLAANDEAMDAIAGDMTETPTA